MISFRFDSSVLSHFDSSVLSRFDSSVLSRVVGDRPIFGIIFFGVTTHLGIFLKLRFDNTQVLARLWKIPATTYGQSTFVAK